MSRMTYILITVFLLFVWCTSCNTNKHFLYTDQKKGRAVFINTQGLIFGKLDTFPTIVRKITSEDRVDTKCAFASIPGAFFGPIVEPFFGHFTIKNSNISITVDPSVFDKRLQIAQVNTINPEPITALTVSPPETQFARVGTFCETHPSGLTSEAGIELLLTYFDRPAKIRGTLANQAGSIDIDLSIPAAGFYYVEKEPKSRKHGIINKIHPEADVFYLLMEK